MMNRSSTQNSHEFIRFLSVDLSKIDWESGVAAQKWKESPDFVPDGFAEIDTECGIDRVWNVFYLYWHN
jgi:hypothetical protein